jgi:hypothetical protein
MIFFLSSYFVFVLSPFIHLLFWFSASIFIFHSSFMSVSLYYMFLLLCFSPSSSHTFLFLCHLFFRTRFLFVFSSLLFSFPLSVFLSLLRSILPSFFPLYFFCVSFAFLFIPAPSFLRSSPYADLFSLPSLASFSPNKFIRNKLWIAKKYHHRTQYPRQGVSCW